MIFDVIEGEDVIVFFDARHGLFAVDVLKRLDEGTTAKLLISDHHHLVHFLFTVLSPAFIILLLLLLHYQFKLYISLTDGKPVKGGCFFTVVSESHRLFGDMETLIYASFPKNILFDGPADVEVVQFECIVTELALPFRRRHYLH